MHMTEGAFFSHFGSNVPNYYIYFCLFDLMLYIPVNNLSVMSGWVLLS